MRRIRRHLTYSNVMVTILAFIVLSGGTAVALSGTNTVFTDDIADDTRPASGGNPAGGLVAADLRAGSVGSSEVADNSLRAADLGVKLRNGRQPASAAACGTGATFSPCVSTNPINIPRAQRLLLLGSGEWTGTTMVSRGECQIEVGNQVFVGGTRTFGESVSSGSAPSFPFNFSINTVTPVLPAGAYELGLGCREVSGSMEVRNAELTVVALGDNT
jgi:hypothetical protein